MAINDNIQKLAQVLLQAPKPVKRARLRDLGIKIGNYPTGKFNSITDVPGVRVGHSTIIEGSSKSKSSKGVIRSGVTAILPIEGDVFQNRVIGSGFILNGAGEVAGITQVMEWGTIETPILLTNTLSVGTCSEALVKYMVEKHPGIGTFHDVIIPVVGECDDSWLNDISGRHIKEKHIYEAIDKATSGPVAEGSVGGGTGMITCDFKAGIGTSSRKLPQHLGGYTVGVLVMSNFGKMKDLRVDGVPVGRIIEPKFTNLLQRKENYGSIIAVIGTNAPLSPHQVARLSKRGALGIGRAGSLALHGSGEIIIGFSNANTVPRETKKMVYRMKVLIDKAIDPIYEIAVEATEEAILNSLCMAEDMEGRSGNIAPALPLDALVEIMKKARNF